MLFNLTNQTAFKVINTDKAIVCGKNEGPTFNGALWTDGEPFNGDNKCWSEYGGVYESRVDADGFDRLIHRKKEGQWNTNFSITELEVWAVKFSTE